MQKLSTILLMILAASLIFFQSIASGSILQLTNNDYNDTNPQIHNGQVVWKCDLDYIFFWDGKSTKQISESGRFFGGPQIHNGLVVWDGEGFNPEEIFYWDGSSVKSLSYRLYSKNPQIDNGQVVWEDWYEGCDIFYWDGSELHRITEDNEYGRGENTKPQIHNGKVVWQFEKWQMPVEPPWEEWLPTEIRFWDGNPTHSFQQLTDNNNDDINPQIHNGKVVWSGSDGNDFEIFYWDGTSIQQLTNNSYDDVAPQIHNGKVVWCADNGKDFVEIFHWNGTSMQQLTNNSYDDVAPQIHNGQVVWQGYDGKDWEIFYWVEDVLEVVIDIKPGSYPNSINLKSKGKIPVAILTIDDFNAQDVDPETCVFAGGNPIRWNMYDLGRDGDVDMILNFKTQDLDLDQNSTEASLVCETYGGTQIVGSDSVNIVPKGNMHVKKVKNKKKK